MDAEATTDTAGALRRFGPPLRVPPRRKLRLVLALLAAAGVAWPLAYWYALRPPPIFHQESTDSKAPHYPSPRMQIRGFNFHHTVEGRTLLRIEADAFRIEHKKVGFLRFGLIEEAILDNARIGLHVAPAAAAKAADPAPSAAQPAPANPAARSPKGAGPVRYVSDAAFDPQALPGMASKRLAAMIARPAALVFFDARQRTVAQVAAASAQVRFRERDILCEGNVEIRAGGRRLTAGRVALRPESGVVYVPGHFVWEGESERIEGERLVTDLTLAASAPEGRASRDGDGRTQRAAFRGER